MAKEIPLTQGQVTIVDDEDYEELSRFKWMAAWAKTAKRFYAVRGGAPYWPAVSRNGVKYRRVSYYTMHRAVHGKPPSGFVIDHINHDPLDNRRSNLRTATTAQNMSNWSAKLPDCSSRFVGVARHSQSGKWTAQIIVNRRHVYLGIFSTEEEAAAAYNTAALFFRGSFARLNQIESEG